MRKLPLLTLLSIAALSVAGCANKKIVRAAPPSVSTPPPDVSGPMPSPTTPPPVVTTTEPPPEAPTPAPLPAPAIRPVPARPKPAPAAEPAPPKPAAPQISPQLSAQDLDAAKAHTTASMTTAEKNLHQADGKQLNAAQKDLSEKISGFLGQAHEAILADDWVRALNLAEKASVLSAELVKSF